MISDSILNKITALAKKGQGFTAPNPAVAAAVVLKDSLQCMGVHYGAGFDHAEVNALRYVQHKDLSQGVLYVTLEPCCHYGRKPPCVDAIVRAGINQVVYGYRDPNPLVGGQGVAALMKAGLQCKHMPTAAIDDLYRPYTHWCLTGQPWVTAKLALSAEGAVAGARGLPVAITGDIFNRWVHEQRGHSDMILTTGKTVLQDNPILNARIAGESFAKPLAIIDRLGRTPLMAQCLQNSAETTLYTSKTMKHGHCYEKQGISCIRVPETMDGQLCLSTIIQDLGRQGMHHVWVEAGPTLFMALHEHNLLKRAIVARSRRILGPEALLGLPQGFDLYRDAQCVDEQWMGEDKITIVDF